MLVRAAYVATAFGHEAVVVFFVLSGMLVGGAVIDTLRSDRWSPSHYVRQRTTRLYVGLVPGLALTAFWDSIGRFAPNASLYSTGRSTLLVFAGNLAFLQGTLVPSFGSNTPLWSLANEACYYAAFPLIFVPLYRRRGWSAATVGLTLICLFGIRNNTIPSGFVLWLMGVAAAHSPKARWMAWRTAPLVGGLSLAVTLAVAHGVAPGFASDLCAAIGTVILLMTICEQRGRCSPFMTILSRELSSCSYTLYVVHMPIIACFAAWRLSSERLVPTTAIGVEVVAVLILILAYAYGVAQLTERHTDKIRAWLSRA